MDNLMTTTVKKGTNRKSAMAKKSRHDQRTPLPPKGTPIKTVKESREKTEEVRDAVAGVGTKAAMFSAYAKEHGWWSKVETDKVAGTIRVTCKRDDGRYKETITAEWHGSRVPEGGVVYSFVGGRNVLLRNVSAARGHIDGTKPVKRDAAPRRVKRRLTSSGEEVHLETSTRRQDPPPSEAYDGAYTKEEIAEACTKAHKAALKKHRVKSGAKLPADVRDFLGEDLRRAWCRHYETVHKPNGECTCSYSRRKRSS